MAPVRVLETTIVHGAVVDALLKGTWKALSNHWSEPREASDDDNDWDDDKEAKHFAALRWCQLLGSDECAVDWRACRAPGWEHEAGLLGLAMFVQNTRGSACLIGAALLRVDGAQHTVVALGAGERTDGVSVLVALCEFVRRRTPSGQAAQLRLFVGTDATAAAPYAAKERAHMKADGTAPGWMVIETVGVGSVSIIDLLRGEMDKRREAMQGKQQK